ncbi:hypothetical protein C5Y96_09870 [Blastopirellula marina]|uniref:EF-hand domain-containing protein n=1 Tax=Blastopirellula marina TaxID=124 RepID=A0A2S8FLX7_9BACT|nr:MULTISPECIES: hypothetical protein [Pirellulaceae]PQO33157.1 hypothetical protein C5Y96_09870 [Blastopirellula marina]RCS52246.1 hypothetical protein DTL36_09880 [Bremerella cremea]
MAVIGNISIGFRANAKGLKKGADQARGILNKLGGGIMKVSGMIAGLGAAVGVAAAAAKFTQMAVAQAENIKYSTRLAKQIGTTTKALTGLQYAAKKALGTDDIEGFGDALSDMQEKIGDVTLEEGGAKDILEQLGLDADTMASQDAEENFLQIADAISGMQNQAEKLHVADTLFGGEGQKMLPLLEKGRKGIEEMQAEAEKMGLTFTEMEAHQVVKVQQAIGHLQDQFQGLANQMVIQVAPYVSALIDEFERMGLTGVDSTQAISQGLGFAADGIGIVGDSIDFVMDGFKFLQSGLTKYVAWVVNMYDYLARYIDTLMGELYRNTGVGMETNISAYTSAIAEDLHKLSADQWDGAMKSFTDKTPSERIDNFFDRMQKGAEKARNAITEFPPAINKATGATMKLGKAVKDLESSLQEQIATFGMSGTEVDIWRLKQQGATEQQLASARKLADQLKSLDEHKTLQEDAKALIDTLKTPEELYQDRIAKLTKMLNTNDANGNTLISFEQFTKAAKMARDEIFGEQNNEKRFASLSEFGSVEARNDIVRHMFGGGNDPEKTQRDQLAEQKKSAQSLARIEKKLSAPHVASLPTP